MFSLSNEELTVMEAFRKKALRGGLIHKPWATQESFPSILPAICRTEHGMTVRLQAPLTKVARHITSRLKPHRSQISAVKLVNGQLQEYRLDPDPVSTSRPAEPRVIELPRIEEFWNDIRPARVVAATTVAVPVRGCPVPEFVKADIRATKVLETFLNPEQLEDFRRTNQFVTVGQDTGRRYLLTSRTKPNQSPKYGNRTMFDLDRNIPICVHDWDVPAAEELLGLHLFLSLPGWESWMLELPE
jgi:hypothetical protein